MNPETPLVSTCEEPCSPGVPGAGSLQGPEGRPPFVPHGRGGRRKQRRQRAQPEGSRGTQGLPAAPLPPGSPLGFRPPVKQKPSPRISQGTDRAPAEGPGPLPVLSESLSMNHSRVHPLLCAPAPDTWTCPFLPAEDEMPGGAPDRGRPWSLPSPPPSSWKKLFSLACPRSGARAEMTPSQV